MMGLVEEVEVWLHREPVDFRRQINGLVLLVEQEKEADPFAKRIYAFTNRRRDRARLLYWDRNGFALWLKRLERGHFACLWEEANSCASAELTMSELALFLEGSEMVGRISLSPAQIRPMSLVQTYLT